MSDTFASKDALNKLSDEIRGEVEFNRRNLAEKMETIEKEAEQDAAKLSETVENIKNSLEDNLSDSRAAQGDLARLDRDLQETKEKLTASVETMDSLESRHTETVHRMKEVTILTTEIENYVRTVESKISADSADAFAKINKDVDELQDFRADIQSNNDNVWRKMNDMERNIAAAKDAIGDEVDGRLASQKESLSSQLHQVDLENKDLREKVVQLEEGHSLHVNKISMMETLRDQIQTVEMARQQSDARYVVTTDC